MKLNKTGMMIVYLIAALPIFAETDTNAIRREISYIEKAADDLMKMVLDVPSRSLRRRMASEIDELYEAAERLSLIVSEQDTVPKPVREEDLMQFLLSIENASFGDVKVDMIQEFGRSNWFTVAQVGRIVEDVSFGEDKIEAIVALYPHIVDPQNNYMLFEYVTFNDDREVLKVKISELGD